MRYPEHKLTLPTRPPFTEWHYVPTGTLAWLVNERQPEHLAYEVKQIAGSLRRGARHDRVGVGLPTSPREELRRRVRSTRLYKRHMREASRELATR